MLNTPSLTWVKNVYSLRKAHSITSGPLYTDVLQKSINPQTDVYNLPVLPQFIPAFYTLLSTHFLVNLPPLIHHLYPQSTAPTIKRIKKI